MKKLVALLALFALFQLEAAAQSNPNTQYNFPAPIGVGTPSSVSTNLNLPAGTATRSTMNIACTSVPPTTPNNGDFWCTSAGLFVQVAGSTYGPLGTGGAGGHILYSTTAPTLGAGWGTSPSVVSSNGTGAFLINVGSGGTATTGIVNMPAATTGWYCDVNPTGAPQAGAEMFSSPTSTTSITITNYTASTGIALAWTASMVIGVQCTGY